MRILPYISTAISALLFLLLSWFPALSIVRAAVQFSSPLPLEVRSPYLNFWTPVATSNSELTDTEFFFTEAFDGRTALIRIDGVTHSIFGQTSLIGPIELTATFFSPIEPGDWVRQSIPFTYLQFELEVTDGNAHDIQLYLHTQSGDFFVSDGGQNITWSAVSTGQSVYEMAQLQTQRVFSENAGGQAEWGQYYFATAWSNDITYGVDSADSLISTFSAQGSLKTVPDSISPVEGINNISTAFALTRNFGNITTNATAVFAIGFVQDPAVQYVNPTGEPQWRVPYYKTKYSSPGSLIDGFLGDFEDAWSRGLELESQIDIDAESEALPADYYSSLLSLVTRLTYASTVLTVGETPVGVLDPTDVMMFMRNSGAAAATNRVNPAEVLYAAFPMFMYFDPTLGGRLLEPLLRYQSSSYYTQPYAALDAGTAYPNASFASAFHNQGVEQTANMLIMMYAYARASGDGSLINKYYPLMERWANYLVDKALFTTSEESADLQTGANQTNLAIKGIIAIKAMSVMGAAIAKSTDYSATANAYYNQWKSLALGSDLHVLSHYGNESSWSLGYNMFADRWLQTGLISEDIITAQVNFLRSANITRTSPPFGIAGIGIPLDSWRPDNVTYSSNMFVAGFADQTLQRLILSGMESHPLADDASIANLTTTSWSARLVQSITSPSLLFSCAFIVTGV
ncbi:hypothetical protein B0F90DRAFT_973382 [Multifurca ochricompacta]|uniref:Glutaminase n=1 Tax=Multifurca ochricompacta TaxID=376703 RepID=A0AAD4MAU2_9AGAM|nr:hypothetical protein B0F90DRAFT_973382 [Multifurca ochricompacta]